MPAGRLAELEEVIERGLETFVEVGNALMAIRDERLYRPEFKTFDRYLRERWKGTVSRSYASRLIGAAGIVKMLPTGNTPATEAVARELSPLADDSEKLREVWGEVTAEHGEHPTAADVRAAVQERLPEPTPQAPKDDVEAGEEVPEEHGAATVGRPHVPPPKRKLTLKELERRLTARLRYYQQPVEALDELLARAKEPLPGDFRRWLLGEARKRARELARQARELTQEARRLSKWADRLARELREGGEQPAEAPWRRITVVAVAPGGATPRFSRMCRSARGHTGGTALALTSHV